MVEHTNLVLGINVVDGVSFPSELVDIRTYP